MAPEPEDEIKDEKNPRPLDEDDIALLKTYVPSIFFLRLFFFSVFDLVVKLAFLSSFGTWKLIIVDFACVGVLLRWGFAEALFLNAEVCIFMQGLGPYSTSIKKAEKEIKDMAKKVNDLCGIKESDTGLAAPSQWDLVSDKQMMQEEQPLQVARCTKIISPNSEDAKYVINVKQIAKFVVGLGDKVSPTDIEEGMRVGVDRNKYQIQIPLPPKIDPSVTMMTVEEKPDVTYNDVGGCKEQIEKMREVVELPMLHPEKFVKLGIDPPKGVLCYGPPGTGKTLLARAVANRTDACFIRVIGSELVQKYVGEGARMVRELFQMARSKKACIVFFDEVDAIGGARFDDGVGGDNEVQRTMLEIVNQLDGFDARGNIKVLMATNRPDTLDPALLRPGRLDRKVEFGLPDLESRTQIFKIHTRTMNCERDIRFELLARLCPNSTGKFPISKILLCCVF
ncbi:26S proteasome regulatory subunit 7A [Citrus sinensis]|nr:26S proteasome regulatory subunit 7A [Citrus sinensis]